MSWNNPTLSSTLNITLLHYISAPSRVNSNTYSNRIKSENRLSWLKVALLNAQSLPSNIDNFRTRFVNESCHIIAITESWLRVYMLDALVALHGYYILRHDRTFRVGGGGGICIFVHKSIDSKCLCTSANLDLHPEFMMVEISPAQSSKLIFCLVYRPPRIGFLTDFTDAFAEISHLYSDYIIVGDFNANMMCQTTDSRFLQKFIDDNDSTILMITLRITAVSLTLGWTQLLSVTWIEFPTFINRVYRLYRDMN